MNFWGKKSEGKGKEENKDTSEAKKNSGLAEKLVSGMGRVVFSQGLFIIIIICLTTMVCREAKKESPVKTDKKEAIQEEKK